VRVRVRGKHSILGLGRAVVGMVGGGGNQGLG